MLNQFVTKQYNRDAVINMYHQVTVQKITLFTESLSDEISNDERIKDYIDNLTSDNGLDRPIDNLKTLITIEYERLRGLSNNDLRKMTDKIISQNLNVRIDTICMDFNKMFYHDGLSRRFIRDNNSIVIIKVTEEIKNNIWNVVAPWSQKYCVSIAYMSGIELKDIEKEFAYYPKEELINYLTGDPLKCIVFPRTSLSKILKVINGIKIRGAIRTTHQLAQ